MVEDKDRFIQHAASWRRREILKKIGKGVFKKKKQAIEYVACKIAAILFRLYVLKHLS